MLSEDCLDFAPLPGELSFSPADLRVQHPDACHTHRFINPQLTQIGSTAGSERQFGQGMLHNGLKTSRYQDQPSNKPCQGHSDL